MSNLTIKGVVFDRNHFSDLKKNRFGCLDGHFGIYIFCNGKQALYVGRSGEKPDQDRCLCDRINQYFNPNDSGVSFPRRWMKRKGKQFDEFIQFANKLELLTISTTEKSDHAIKVIKGIEQFLIRQLDPPYNFKYYDLLCPEEEKNILNVYCEEFG